MSSLRLEQSVGPIIHLLSSAPHKKAIRPPKYIWASFPSLWRSCCICHKDKPRCHVLMHTFRSSSDGMQSPLVLMNTCAIVATPVCLTVTVKYRNCMSFAKQVTRRWYGDCTVRLIARSITAHYVCGQLWTAWNVTSCCAGNYVLQLTVSTELCLECYVVLGG
jgi:hypothetical protein